MNWRRFAWLTIVLLMITIGWAIVDLKTAYDKIASVKSKGGDDTDRRLVDLQKRIAGYEGQIKGLEELALWPPGLDAMSWLTQQADESDVSIVGVEHLSAEKLSEYQYIPFKITLKGGYHPLGRFINRLEHSPNALRIDSLRIKRREYTPEDTIMELSLSYFQKAWRA